MFNTPAKTPSVALAAAALLGAALIGSCQSIVPQDAATAAASTADSACVSRCDLKKTQCEERQKLREQDCQMYRDQLVPEGGSCITRIGSSCVEPVDCLGADEGICQTQLRECILECPKAETEKPAPNAPDQSPAKAADTKG